MQRQGPNSAFQTAGSGGKPEEHSGRVLVVASQEGQFSAGVSGTDAFLGGSGRRQSGEENKGLRILYMRKELESCRKLLILPELLWHTLWVAHPVRESNSAHKLLGGEPGPAKPLL